MGLQRRSSSVLLPLGTGLRGGHLRRPVGLSLIRRGCYRAANKPHQLECGVLSDHGLYIQCLGFRVKVGFEREGMVASYDAGSRREKFVA